MLSDEQLDARHREYTEAHRDRVLSTFIHTVPSRFKRARLGDFSTGFADVAMAWIKDPGDWSMFLWGDNSKGQTHAAFAVAVAWTAWHVNRPATWIFVPDLLADIKKQFDVPKGHRVVPVVERLAEYPGLLLSDDIASEKDTEFAVQELYRIIYRREADYLKTVLTSNCNLARIETKLDRRIAARLEGGKVINLKGKNRRVKSEGSA